jgi:gamma-glutamyltranspeptidase/glutathione hydrolase
MPAPVFPHAAVASPHYLASTAGLGVLMRGGNAVDAAIATNLVLAVAYPHMCGLGGDLLAQVWSGGELAGINSSGRLPANAPKVESVPRRGIGSATVPGAVAGWRAMLDRYGTMPLSELVKPAARLAREGCPRVPGLELAANGLSSVLERDPEAKRIFLGEGPLVQAEMAETLDDIDNFYSGPVAQNAPAPFTRQDFAEHEAQWVEPERLDWQGLEVCEMPPTSRGYLALRALEAMEPLDRLTPDDAEWHMRQIRAIKAVDPAMGARGDTIYLSVRDENGMAVSLNQSLSAGFGSGVMVPGTGVLLHSRGEYFTPEEYVGRAVLPRHTLSPAMALRDGEPCLLFGLQGGESQIQVHLQLLARIFIAGQELGDAVAAPRWRITRDALWQEPGLPDLGGAPYPYESLAGHANPIHVRGPREIAAAFDPRSDGAAVGY